MLRKHNKDSSSKDDKIIRVTRSQIECKSSICGRFLFVLIQKSNILGKVLLTITTLTRYGVCQKKLI